MSPGTDAHQRLISGKMFHRVQHQVQIIICRLYDSLPKKIHLLHGKIITDEINITEDHDRGCFLSSIQMFMIQRLLRFGLLFSSFFSAGDDLLEMLFQIYLRPWQSGIALIIRFQVTTDLVRLDKTEHESIKNSTFSERERSGVYSCLLSLALESAPASANRTFSN